MKKRKNGKSLLRKWLLGTQERMGALPKTLLYVLLIAIGFVYIYPLLNMLITSLESLDDLLDPAVQWLPHKLRLDNYEKAFQTMGVAEHLVDTLELTLLPALMQTISCALAGYAFARFNFKGKRLLLLFVLLTFIVPFPVLMMPTYSLYSKYNILGSIWTIVFPAMTGQGLRAAIFILIYRAFYAQTPRALDEAARVDGASEKRVFFTIGLPLGLPAMLTSFLFSFVWYWNDTYMNNLYVAGVNRVGDSRQISTLMMELVRFEDSYSAYLKKQYGSAAAAAATGAANVQNEAVTMAGTMLAIAVPLLLYFLLQKYFVNAIDRSGITGE